MTSGRAALPFSEAERHRSLAIQRALIARRELLRRRMPLPDDGLDALIGGAPEPGSVEAFAAFALQHLARSRAPILQDLWVLWECGARRGGYFVALGPAAQKAFMLVRDFGWFGLAVDLDPASGSDLAGARTREVPRTGRNPAGAFARAAEPPGYRQVGVGDGAARFYPRQAASVGLDRLLDIHEAPAAIDYISVDAAGSAVDILSAFDFARRPVRLVAVAHQFRPYREDIFARMTAAGYRRRFPAFSRFEDWYVHEGAW